MARFAGPFLVIFGSESFNLDRLIAKRKQVWREKGKDVVYLDGSTTSEADMVSVCSSQDVFGDTDKAVILDNAQDMKLSGLLASYVEGKDRQDASVMVLVVIRSSAVPKPWKELVGAMGGKGKSEEFQKLKPWEAEKAIGRISDEGSKLGLKLEPGLPEYMYRCLGDNLRLTVNELQKMTYLVGPEGVVKRALVELVIAKDIPVDQFQVAREATSKNGPKALALAALLYRNDGDSASIRICSALMSDVEKLLMAKQLLDKGEGSAVVAQAVGLHEFVCKKTLIPVAQKHTVAQLMGHMKNLCKLDSQVKGAARSKRTLVELAILSIATGA